MGKLANFFGAIGHFDFSDYQLSFSSEQKKGSIRFYNDNIVRIRLSATTLTDKHSYAVVMQPQDRPAHFEQKANLLSLKTTALEIQLNLENAQISCFSPQGAFINGDALPVSWIGTEVTVCKKLQQEEKFIGLGEKTGPLNRRGNAYTNWNTDKFAYDVEEDPLYLSTPFYIGVHNNQVYGIFLDNSHRSTFNFGASTERFSWFSAEDGEMDYYFIYGNSVGEIIQHYTQLTGRMKMPPKWSLGFQQCRYSYYPEQEIYQLADTFRAKQIPCDVLYLDIHYMQDYKAFTFNQERFPNPQKMVADIRKMGFKTAVILDPGIKVEEGYAQYDSGVEEDIFVKYPDGPRYTGEVWPGASHFPDFTNPKARRWWGDQMPYYTNLGVKGFWNDMNEPAAWGQCLPNFIEFNYDGQPTTHREARNVYGMQMARSTAEGIAYELKNERPFVLTRAGFCGIQRYCAVWTGDNVSSDEHLMLGVRLVNSLGLTGISYCGNDVGGFAGEASPALYARWVSIGAFQPFFRAHSVVNSRDAEPWSFGEEVEQIARNYISLRYQLMPLIYSLFRASQQSGLPINRSLAFSHPHENKIYLWEYQHQFMLGEQLLIAPVESNKDFLKVLLPEGHWYNFWTGEQYPGNQEIIVDCPSWKLPVFAKAGAIIPMQEKVQHLDEDYDTLILQLYAGAEGSLHYYEDDGLTYDYEQEGYHARNIKLKQQQLTLEAATGDYSIKVKKLKLIFHGLQPTAIQLNGQPLTVKLEDYRHMDSIKSIDTFSTNKGEEMMEKNLTIVETAYSPDLMIFNWTLE